MRVFCINRYCYRFAIGNGEKTAKQRQECIQCKKRESDDEKLQGYKIIIKDPKKQGDRRTLKIIPTNIVFVCPRYCKNSFDKYEGGTRTNPISFVNEKTKEKGTLYVMDNNIKEDFYCPIMPSKYRLVPKGIYDIDHINGNHFDNTYMNVQSLCKICHEVKTTLSGDRGTGKTNMKDKNDNDKEDALAAKITAELRQYTNLNGYLEKLKENINGYTTFLNRFNIIDTFIKTDDQIELENKAMEQAKELEKQAKKQAKVNAKKSRKN